MSTTFATAAVPTVPLHRRPIRRPVSRDRGDDAHLASLVTVAIPAAPSSPIRHLAVPQPVADTAAPAPARRRRMAGLYVLKPWFTRVLTPVVNTAVARCVSPDAFTAAGVVAAGGAAASVAFGCWPLAALFMVLRLAGANLDGAVARASGRSRPWGFVVNEVGDRASDLVAFGGLAVWAARQSGPGLHWLSWPVIMVLIAALAATLPTFAALAAAGAGASRPNGGPLGKTERCVIVVLATAFPVILPVVSMQMVNGSLLTTALRLRAAHRELAAQRQLDQQPSAVVERLAAPRPALVAVPA